MHHHIQWTAPLGRINKLLSKACGTTCTLEMNGSSVESHGKDAFYGIEHEGKCVCLCVKPFMFGSAFYCVHYIYGNMHAFSVT